MSLLRQKTPKIREKRLQAINAFYEAPKALSQEFDADDVKQRIRTFSQDTLSDIIYALEIINRIQNSVVIVHGPKGCAASQVYFESKTGYDGKWAVTNLNEKDSIVGSEELLKEAALSLYRRYKPEVIFIVTTPVVAINNDDVNAVAEELREHLGVEVVPVYSDGFKSKIGAGGYDLLQHALGKYLYQGMDPIPEDSINIISLAENNVDLEEIKRITKELGLKTNVLPQKANGKIFQRAANAKASISLNPDDGGYLGKVLEERFGISYLETPLPVGIEGTSQWISALGKHLGIEKEADAVNDRETKALKDFLSGTDFNGLTVYLNLPAAYAFGIKVFLEELGASVSGITVPYIQSSHDKNLAALLREDRELKLHIAEGQTFEEINILKRLNPDLYIGWAGQTVSASRLGIPSVSLKENGVLGFKGAYRLVSRISKVLKNPSFIKRLSQDANEIYQAGWYLKKPNWYLKQEVK